MKPTTMWFLMVLCGTAQTISNGARLSNGAALGLNSAPVLLTGLSGGTQSGTVNLTASIASGASSDYYCFLIDGAFYYQGTPSLNTSGPGCVNGGSSSVSFALDTTKLSNGAHQVWVSAPTIGVSRHSAFTVSNPTAPFELRAGYSELWLTVGGTATLAPKLKNTDGSFTSVPLGEITSGATYPGTLKAIYLGAPSDTMGPYSLTASNSVYDYRIRLQGLKATPADILVTNGSRTWEGPTLPINGWYYLKTAFDGLGNGDLWLDSIGSTSFTVQITFPDTSTAAVTSTLPEYAWFESANPSVATVNQATGVVTGVAVGDTVIAASYGGFTTYVLAHVNTANVTPHFGNDGSILTAYDPAKSIFVRELFFGQPDLTDSQNVADFQAAAVNTVEATLYVGPTSNDYNAWHTYIQNTFWTPVENQVAAGFNVLFTGEELARGDDRLYDSTRGYGHTMTPSPIAAAFTWAKGLGHAIGVDMVDEVSFAFGANPLPEGQLGATNGPTSIACVSNACTVTWPGWTLNGAGRFLITGAVTDTNLNVDINHYYVGTPVDASHFTFTASGVGTHTFTAATDPALTLQIFAYAGHGTDGLDYTHNDAFTVLMDTIHTTDGNRPPITWPVAGDTVGGIGPWVGNPYMADYATLYWSFLGKSYPWGSTLLEAKYTWDNNITTKYPYVQRSKPILWLAPGISSNYVPVAVRGTVASITNDSFVFAAPHGVTSGQLSAGKPRFLVAGSSNSALNGKYYVYSITNATTLKAYAYDIVPSALVNVPSAPNNVNGTATFSGAGAFPLYAYSSSANTAGLTFAGTCPGVGVAGQTVTISGDTILPAINGTSWYVREGGDGCNIGVSQLRSGSGTGGYVDMIYNNDAPPAGDNGQLPLLRATSIMWAAAKGLAGTRVYVYSTDFNKVPGWNNMFPGDCTNVGICGIQNGLSPRYNGPDAVAGWRGMSNAYNLVALIEPYLLQPKLPSPDYGPHIVSAARTSSYGKMLMLINMAEGSATELVDLSPYGTSATMYRMSGLNAITTSTVSGSSTSVAFAPGETVVFTFAP